MNFRYSLGGLFALMMVVCAYLATAMNSDDPSSHVILSVINPLIFLLAALAWMDPGFVSRATVAVFRAAARVVWRGQRFVEKSSEPEA